MDLPDESADDLDLVTLSSIVVDPEVLTLNRAHTHHHRSSATENHRDTETPRHRDTETEAGRRREGRNRFSTQYRKGRAELLCRRPATVVLGRIGLGS